MTGSGAGEQPEGDDLAALERAISALEAQRALLGDAVVDTALVPLQQRRSTLVNQATGEQRRLVSIVFADLVGFTDMSEWLDAEDTRNVVDSYFTRWLRVIEEHGGVVEKFIGDAVMAVFGLRQSWEDDAQRAVRSALAMVGELTDLNTELEKRYRVRLQMRVGVDTGDVVVSTLGDRGGSEFVVVGQTVNRASRLQGAAPPGGILISSDTHRQIRGRFSMERREGLVLKGIDEPVVAYLVVNERPQAFQLDRSRGVEGVETTTVGREIEMRFLQERLWDVVEEGHWKLVTVVGEAGVGKSRLLLEFDSWLAESPQPVYWFRGRASHTGQNRANGLLRDLVSSRLAIADSDSAEVVRGKLENGFVSAWAVTEDDPDEARRAARLVGSWLAFDIDDESDDDGTYRDPLMLRNAGTEALAGYLARLSTRNPVVVLLEDLHWADDGSLRWLDVADAYLANAQVLVVATARPSLFEERPRWGEGLDHHMRLPLDTLSRRESRLLLQQLLQHVEQPPTELLDLVIASAEGNPFYIEELVTWLIDAGVIVKDEPMWRVERDLVGSVLVPSTLRGVLQARLDALSTEERGLLQRASVVGRVFWDEAVDSLATSDAGDDVTRTLDGLRSRELVFEREVSSFDSAREFLFKHALLRDVAYDGVLRKHRQRYHARAATWLSEVSARSGRQDEYAALIAEHYDRAGDPAAGEWYFRAGKQALSVYALAEADQLLGRALGLVTEDPLLRFDVLAIREDMHDRVGDRDAQQLDLTEMGELIERFDDPGRLASYRTARSRACFALSRYDEAEDWAEQAADAAGDGDLLAELALAHLWQGKALVWHEETDEARIVLDGALDEARRAEQRRLEAEALRYLSMLSNHEGDYPLALELVGQARKVFASVGDAEGEGTALGQQATTLFNLGRIDEARAALEAVLPLFRRSGHRYRESIVVGNLATIAYSQGELATAQRWAQEAIVHSRALGDRESTTVNLLVLGMVAAGIGDFDEADQYYREALELGREVESRTHEAEALTRIALLLLERGDDEAALPVAEEADRAGELVTSSLEQGHARLVLGYAQLVNAQASAAKATFALSEESFTSIEAEAVEREARVGRAAAALARGELADAVQLVEGVLDHLDTPGLEGSVRPTVMLTACWTVLRAAGDPRAPAVLAAAQATLRDAADRIGDDEMTMGFLTRPDNAALLRARGDQPPDE
jgi:class 3 adenylate cyclase/tetratricopeptide (TPR) repeat protein